MNVREVYDVIGGGYEDALSRMFSDELIGKFLRMFLDDPSYDQLVQAMEEEDVQAAFAAAHTLKGVAANVGILSIATKASDITEVLRDADSVAAAEPMMPVLAILYNKVRNAIEQLD